MFCICVVRFPLFRAYSRITLTDDFTFQLRTTFISINQFASDCSLRSSCWGGLFEPLASFFYLKPSASALIAYTSAHFVNWIDVRLDYRFLFKASTFSLNLLGLPSSKEFSIFFLLWDLLIWKTHLMRISNLWLTPCRSRYALATKISHRGHTWSLALASYWSRKRV